MAAAFFLVSAIILPGAHFFYNTRKKTAALTSGAGGVGGADGGGGGDDGGASRVGLANRGLRSSTSPSRLDEKDDETRRRSAQNSGRALHHHSLGSLRWRRKRSGGTTLPADVRETKTLRDGHYSNGQEQFKSWRGLHRSRRVLDVVHNAAEILGSDHLVGDSMAQASALADAAVADAAGAAADAAVEAADAVVAAADAK